MISTLASMVLAATMTMSSNATDGSPTDVIGDWMTPAGDSIVTIYDCGDGTPCGRLSWIDTETVPTTVDEYNQDPEKKGRPLVGIVMLESFEKHRSGWRRGTIYNPRDGKTYRSKIARQAGGILEVKGCVGPFCQTQNWIETEQKPMDAALEDTATETEEQ